MHDICDYLSIVIPILWNISWASQTSGFYWRRHMSAAFWGGGAFVFSLTLHFSYYITENITSKSLHWRLQMEHVFLPTWRNAINCNASIWNVYDFTCRTLCLLMYEHIYLKRSLQSLIQSSTSHFILKLCTMYCVHYYYFLYSCNMMCIIVLILLN